VLFDVSNDDAELMPQMTAQVVFVSASASQALTVALTAVEEDKSREGAHVARVLDADGQPQARKVKVGIRSRHQVEVLEGLAEGEKVVIGETPLERGPRWLQW
jgi:macrolide-specific efflux system membrane fusion protein